MYYDNDAFFGTRLILFMNASINIRFFDASGLVLTVIRAEKEVAESDRPGPDVLKSCLGELAGLVLALMLVVGQSAFWILTVGQFGLPWVLYPALLVVVNDTAAYIFGCLFGKTKLLPVLSPSKTWEGFLGAALSTFAVAVPTLYHLAGKSDSATALASSTWVHALAMAAFVSLVAPFGGFLASAAKRAYGAKDFGSFIPGHGGVVDRMDCHLVSAPFVYLYLRSLSTLVKGSGDATSTVADVVADLVTDTVADVVSDVVSSVADAATAT